MNRRLLIVPIGIILLLIGFVWFLQGVGILPGSFMTGSQFWAIAGGITVIVGLALIGVGLLKVRGEPKGGWVEAKAHLVEAEAYPPIIDMLRTKYGFQFWLLSHLHGKGRIVFEIERGTCTSR